MNFGEAPSRALRKEEGASLPLVIPRRSGAQPQRDVGRLHRLPHYARQVSKIERSREYVLCPLRSIRL
jgi:hypothetical protein